ncbi:MAG: replication initiation protein [Cytophagales bacterium]|nr:replication initiation protein [Cytophagales bacterium]
MSNTLKIKADNYRIVKSNKLVNSRQPFSALQQRIITLLASRINPNDDKLREHKFDVSEFYINRKIGGKQYNDIKNALNGLMDGKIEIESFLADGTRKWLRYNLFSKAEYVEKTKTASLSFAPDMKNFFLHLKGNYTSYFLKDVNSFNRTYTIRIYELCKQYFPRIKERKIELENLKFLLAIENKYPAWYNFKRDVLDQSLKEINQYSDLTVSFETEKRNRKVSAVIFHISGKASCETSPPQLVISKADAEQERTAVETIDAAAANGAVPVAGRFELPDWLTRRQYDNLLKKGFSPELIQQGIDAIEFKDNVKVPSAYLYKGLKAGWFASADKEDSAPSAAVRTSQAAEQQAALKNMKERVIREFDEKRNELLDRVNVDEDAIDEFVFAFDGTEDHYLQKCVNQLNSGELSSMNRRKVAVWLVNNEEENYSEEELMLANSRIGEYANKHYGLQWGD